MKPKTPEERFEEDLYNTSMVLYLFIANVILFFIIMGCFKLIMKINDYFSGSDENKEVCD